MLALQRGGLSVDDPFKWWGRDNAVAAKKSLEEVDRSGMSAMVADIPILLGDLPVLELTNPEPEEPGGPSELRVKLSS